MKQTAWKGLAWVLAPALIALTLGGTAFAQTDALPSGEKLLDEMAKAMGGKDAFAKLKNRVIEGSIEMPAMGLKGTLSVYQAAPDSHRMKLEFAGMGSQEIGYTKGVSWETSTMMGARVKEGEEKVAAQREADFDAVINWRDHYKTVKTIGSEKIGEKDTWKLEVTTKGGKTETQWIDKATKLPAKSKQQSESPMGTIEIEIFNDEFQTVDGVTLPKTIRQVMMGGMQEMTIRFTSVKHNQELPTDIFDIPAEIQAIAAPAGN